MSGSRGWIPRRSPGWTETRRLGPPDRPIREQEPDDCRALRQVTAVAQPIRRITGIERAEQNRGAGQPTLPRHS
jgi:hypothetical protein